ncbi:NAD(P)H-binding protein [Flammeovirga agarivorans]|uniref:NAD(P)H-binding protein n=1 Tax=Flammeovirga agarivorans TaxID=2726742 RepID=A0A7X8SJB3_9BACT|nr:NAD(P)H-binding protein [Flammeovirga agarivorans]NLR91299.1 NAD(P)H-binding protein [Flammeovirga agarivorans]
MEFSAIKNVSIIGAGWLGMPLIDQLIEAGYNVKASTSTEEKLIDIRTKGAKAYLLKFTPTCQDMEALKDLLDTDVVIILLPPRFRQHNMVTYHAEQIKVIKDLIEDLPVNKVIYSSSISVYENSNKEINENAEVSHHSKSKAITMAEEVLRINTDLDATILRFGGLMGYDRIPAKYVDGKKDLSYGDIPVNYTFRDDAVRSIMKILEVNDHNSWNKVFNVVAPEHPPKKSVYEASLKYGDYIMPTFSSEDKAPPFKIINSDKIVNKIGFNFIYENPLEFIYNENSI